MARSIWNGSVSFGLVNVPVALYSARSSKTVRFHQFNEATGARVKQKKVDASTGDEVAFENIVKGYELTPDRYVTIKPEELDAIAPKQTKELVLERFVSIGEIDPLAYDSSYYLGPKDGAGRAYRLLVQAMEAGGKVGIGRIILRSKESLVAIRAKDGVLIASTVVFADEVLNPTRCIEEFEAPEPSEAEVRMASSLIDSMTERFDHTAFSDTYREKVLDLIERKAAGETIEAQTDATTDDAPAPDLMAALQASLDLTKADEPAPVPAKKPARKRTTKKAKVAA